MNYAVFLDRDNTLIANDGDLGDPSALRLLDGVPESLMRLRGRGFKLIVITNQGGVARGRYHCEDVERVHAALSTMLDDAAGVKGLIDGYVYCPFHPEGTVQAFRREHSWRKPQPGMLLHAAQEHDLDLAACWMIGDQPRDAEAGRAAGCKTVLINSESPSADVVTTTLAEAVDVVLKKAPR